MNNLIEIISGPYGRHVISKRKLKKGQIVLIEKPEIICKDMYDCIYSLYTEDELTSKISEYEIMVPKEIDNYTIKYKELYEDIKTLPKEMQNFFMNMNKTRLRLLATKYYRNGFTYIKCYGGQSAILFIGNIFNHSCSPNLFYSIGKSGEYIFKALRDIEEGEELTHSYIDNTKSTKKRKEILLNQYGFNCTCAKCM